MASSVLVEMSIGEINKTDVFPDTKKVMFTQT